MSNWLAFYYLTYLKLLSNYVFFFFVKIILNYSLIKLSFWPNSQLHHPKRDQRIIFKIQLQIQTNSQLPRLCNPKRYQRSDNNGSSASHIFGLVSTIWENHGHSHQPGFFATNSIVHPSSFCPAAWLKKGQLPSILWKLHKKTTAAFEKCPFCRAHVFGRHKTWAMQNLKK